MSEGEMAPQSKATKPDAAAETTPEVTPTPETTPDAVPAPDRAGEDFRREWAEANNVDPSEMREIRAMGGWVDHFDGRGWVQEG